MYVLHRTLCTMMTTIPCANDTVAHGGVRLQSLPWLATVDGTLASPATATPSVVADTQSRVASTVGCRPTRMNAELELWSYVNRIPKGRRRGILEAKVQAPDLREQNSACQRVADAGHSFEKVDCSATPMHPKLATDQWFPSHPLLHTAMPRAFDDCCNQWSAKIVHVIALHDCRTRRDAVRASPFRNDVCK